MIASLIFARAERAPAATAWVMGERRLSYGDLARAIEAMVQAFEGQGVAGPGYALVAIGDLMEHWVVSLALRELGLTTAPVMSPQNAAAIGLEPVRLVVVHPGEAWPGLEALAARQGWPLARARWGGALARPIETGRRRADEVGEHVLQTSATTGAYKKVLMARGFEPALLAERGAFDGLDEGSRYAFFDFGPWTASGYRGVASVWRAGGAVVMSPTGDVARCLTEPGLTHAVMLPTQLAAAIAAPREAFARRDDMKLYVSGATPRQPQIDAAHERLTPRIWNSIGATEALCFAETLLETSEDRRWHRLRPSRDPQVVDEAGGPVAVGEVGRLRVSTRNGPTGYLGDAATTAAFFEPGWFYTGDLAKLRPDGRMALMGRATEVINVMGQKISPAPFEDELAERLGASAACLVSRPDEAGDEELVLVLETNRPPDGTRLAAELRRVLGGFPHVRVFFERSLPRNANGKLLRGAVVSRLGR